MSEPTTKAGRALTGVFPSMTERVLAIEAEARCDMGGEEAERRLAEALTQQWPHLRRRKAWVTEGRDQVRAILAALRNEAER